MALPKNSAYVNVNGTWKSASAVWINNGTWKSASAVWINVNGTWRKQNESTVVCTVYGAKNETVSYSGASSGSISLNASGVGTKELPLGSYTFTGKISGYSTTVTIKENATTVRVRPERIIYWYGVEEVAFGTVYGNDYSPTVTRNANSITVSVSRNGNAAAYRTFMTSGTVTLTGYNSLKGVLEGMGINGWYRLCAATNRQDYESGVVASNKPTVTTVDVSSKSGSHYIGINGTSYGRTGATTATIHALWLE